MLHAELRNHLEIAAASGLVGDGRRLYLIADDELALTIYSRDGSRLIAQVPIFPGELPGTPAERKRAKPDLECLALVAPHTLLVLGSGSTPARMRGAMMALGDDGVGPPLPVELGPIYGKLAPHFPRLNIEGAAVAGNRLRLLQRGNGRDGVNAVIDVDLAGFLAALLAGRPPGGWLVRGVTAVDLGALGGVPLGFTDAAPLGDGRLVFAAVAEAAPDAYHDGPCAGSVVGVLAGDRVEALEPLDVAAKIEGVHVLPGGNLLLCSDADDPGVAAALYDVAWAYLGSDAG